MVNFAFDPTSMLKFADDLLAEEGINMARRERLEEAQKGEVDLHHRSSSKFADELLQDDSFTFEHEGELNFPGDRPPSMQHHGDSMNHHVHHDSKRMVYHHEIEQPMHHDSKQYHHAMHEDSKRCFIDGCEVDAWDEQGICQKHLTCGRESTLSRNGKKLCKMPRCVKLGRINGLCINHGGGTTCQVQGCSRKARARGLCKSHRDGPNPIPRKKPSIIITANVQQHATMQQHAMQQMPMQQLPMQQLPRQNQMQQQPMPPLRKVMKVEKGGVLSIVYV